jgi:hypothetical protein
MIGRNGVMGSQHYIETGFPFGKPVSIISMDLFWMTDRAFQT